MQYTKQQLKYIDSVGGRAHLSAVKIIGELETALRNTITVHVISDDEQDVSEKLENKMKRLGF